MNFRLLKIKTCQFLGWSSSKLFQILIRGYLWYSLTSNWNRCKVHVDIICKNKFCEFCRYAEISVRHYPILYSIAYIHFPYIALFIPKVRDKNSIKKKIMKTSQFAADTCRYGLILGRFRPIWFRWNRYHISLKSYKFHNGYIMFLQVI